MQLKRILKDVHRNVLRNVLFLFFSLLSDYCLPSFLFCFGGGASSLDATLSPLRRYGGRTLPPFLFSSFFNGQPYFMVFLCDGGGQCR